MENYSKKLGIKTVISLMIPYIIEERCEEIFKDVCDQYATERILATKSLAKAKHDNGVLCIKL